MANRTNTSVEFEKLTKILQYEIKRGCNNDAVITGLEPFVAHWQDESLARGAGEQDRSRILGIVDALKGYADLDPAERLPLLTALLERISQPAPPVMIPPASSAAVSETAQALVDAAAVHDISSSTVPATTVRAARLPVRQRRPPPPASTPDSARPSRLLFRL